MKILNILDDKLVESKNHMGEREYQTYASWKAACKKAYPGCGYRGDKDIGAATFDGKDVGEWDGAVGTVYAKNVNEAEDGFNSRAGEAYKAAFLGTMEQLRILEAAIERHHQRYEANEANKTDGNASFTFAGDLNHVQEMLAEINAFLN